MSQTHTPLRPTKPELDVNKTEAKSNGADSDTDEQSETQKDDFTSVVEEQSTQSVETKIATGVEVQHAKHISRGGDEVVALPSGEVAERVITGGTATHIQVVDEHNGEETEFVRVYINTPNTTFSAIAQDNEQVDELKTLTDKEIPADGDRHPIAPVEVKVIGTLFPQYESGTHRGTLIDTDHIKMVNTNASVRHLLKSTTLALDRIDNSGDDDLMSESVDEYRTQLVDGLEDIRNMV